jgi:hypothetical protein
MAWQDLEQQYVKESNNNDRSNYLKDIIAGLSIANNNSPQTLLGYGLGRWLSNYVNRGLERRQQEKNQKAYDEWINGGPQQTDQQQEQLMPLMKGTPIVNENKYTFANDIAKEMTGGRPNYIQNAMEANGLNTSGNFFPMPQNTQQEAAPEESVQADNNKVEIKPEQDVKQTAQDIARQMWGGANLSSEEAFSNAYRIARASGSTETQALDFARKTAGQQQAKRIQALSDEFLARGIGKDGVINPYGVQVLSRLAQEDPKQTNVLGNMYQTPLGNTKYKQDLEKMEKNSNLQLRNTIQAQQNQAELRDWLSANEYGRKWEMLTRKEQLDMENKFRTAEIVSQITGAPIQDVVAQMFGGGGRSGAGTGGAGKADNARYKMLKDWIENYNKENRDPVTGEYYEGKGPSDPAYMRRKKAYDSFTDDTNSDDDDTFTAETPEDAIKQIRQKHPDWPPEYIQLLIENMGFNTFQYKNQDGKNEVYSVPQSKASEGNAYTNEELERLRELGILNDEE